MVYGCLFWLHDKQEHKAQVQQLEVELSDKIKEGRRMKENYDALKSMNDTLRKQVRIVKLLIG
jgi:hypothetical protein